MDQVRIRRHFYCGGGDTGYARWCNHGRLDADCVPLRHPVATLRIAEEDAGTHPQNQGNGQNLMPDNT